MYEDLSSKQLEILNFIKVQVCEKGYPPSVREICKGVNLRSTSTVHGHLEKLEKKGYIRKNPNRPRAIEIINRDYFGFNKKIVNVPILGKVIAGKPILAIENIEDTFPIPKTLAEDENIFILRVEGNSMVDAGIYNNDFVLVKQQNVAMNGDIVVALLDDEATIKRFFKEKNYIRLQPENQAMSPICTTNITILGKVIGLFRKL